MSSSSSASPEGTTLGYLHRLGRSEQHTPPSPLTIEQHQHLIHQWNPSITATSDEGQTTTTTTPSSTIHKIIEEGAFRLQLKASRGVRYEQPLATMVRYSSLVREWVVAEGITVGATEEAPPPYTIPHHQKEEEVPSSGSIKTVQLSPLLMEEDGSSSAASSTAAACDYLCKYHDGTVIILRTTRLTEVSATAPTMCAPINAKKPIVVYRLEMLVGPSDRPKNVQQSDMAGELMLDSQFLGMMFNYVKKFHKAQCERAERPVLPALLQAGGGSDELLPGQKKKICQIVEVLGLWEIFEEVHGRFRKELDSAGGAINTAMEPDRESVEPADDAERREEDIAETAKLVEKTMMIAKAKAGETVEIPGADKGAPSTADNGVVEENADKSAKGRSVKEHQAHLEWVESFRNKVKALRNFDNAYEDTKDARLAALRKGPATNQTSSSSANQQQQQDDSDSDDDGMSAMLLGVGCPLCGRQGHPMAECPYSQ